MRRAIGSMRGPVFAFHLGNQVNGKLTIDGVNSAHYTGDFVYSNLVSISYIVSWVPPWTRCELAFSHAHVRSREGFSVAPVGSFLLPQRQLPSLCGPTAFAIHVLLDMLIFFGGGAARRVTDGAATVVNSIEVVLLAALPMVLWPSSTALMVAQLRRRLFLISCRNV